MRGLEGDEVGGDVEVLRCGAGGDGVSATRSSALLGCVAQGGRVGEGEVRAGYGGCGEEDGGGGAHCDVVLWFRFRGIWLRVGLGLCL